MIKEILYVNNLSKSYDGLKLFNQVSFSLEPGTINSLFGRNGSGKTTLFNIIGGYDKPDSGIILFKGRPIKYTNKYSMARLGVGKMWQEPLVFPNHTVVQNLIVCDKTHPGEAFFNYFFNLNSIITREIGLKKKSLDLINKLKIGNKAFYKAGSLSLGERKILGLLMLVMNDSELLLLDEPFSGINTTTIDKISEILLELKSNGKTIFIIEHKMKCAEAISDHLFRIENFDIKSLN
jgi:ABC-type branched-subunit amino acid transport system ATPase component